MIRTNLTRLQAEEGYILTNGVQFVYSVTLNEGASGEGWQEISLEQYRKLIARMTPREFILKLMQKGITREQIEALIDSNDQVWAELNYATLITRANPLLDELCGQFGLTSADVDEIFNL